MDRPQIEDEPKQSAPRGQGSAAKAAAKAMNDENFSGASTRGSTKRDHTDKSQKTATAKATAAESNRGAVERMDSLKKHRPDLAEQAAREVQEKANKKRSEAQKGIPKAEIKERGASSRGSSLPRDHADKSQKSSTAKAAAAEINRIAREVQEKANQKRSEAAKAQPRNKDGTMAEKPVQPQVEAKPDYHESKSRWTHKVWDNLTATTSKNTPNRRPLPSPPSSASAAGRSSVACHWLARRPKRPHNGSVIITE